MHGHISYIDINHNNSLPKLRTWINTIVLYQIQLKSAPDKAGLKVQTMIPYYCPQTPRQDTCDRNPGL